MMELITLAAAQAIAKVAFDKFVEGGAGELGKKTSESVTKLIQKLGEAVWQKAIKGKPQAEKVLTGAAQDSPEDIQKLKNYLNGLWKVDEIFEKEIQTLVHEIYQVIQFENCDAENVLNVFGGTGQQFNNREIQPNASVQQGSITNNNYYGVKPD
jgi:hypothetical protein